MQLEEVINGAFHIMLLNKFKYIIETLKIDYPDTYYYSGLCNYHLRKFKSAFDYINLALEFDNQFYGTTGGTSGKGPGKLISLPCQP